MRDLPRVFLHTSENNKGHIHSDLVVGQDGLREKTKVCISWLLDPSKCGSRWWVY
jgi:hypothetical protein